jgi:aminopeptidase N
LRTWTREHADGLVTTEQFIALAKKQNPGRDLDAFFDAWLFTTGKPACASA